MKAALVRSIASLAFLIGATVSAQESQLGAEFRREGERFKASCGAFSFKKAAGCAQLLFTDRPLHIAVGSIAPQNGFSSGLAFVTNYTPNENWRWSWNVDGVGSFNGSWRAGVYMKMVHTPPKKITVVRPAAGKVVKSKLRVQENTVIKLYSQTISLNKISFFGLGNNTSESARTLFGMRETITGANIVKPIWDRFNVSLTGEVHGRWFQLRGSHDDAPSIDAVHNEATAPGIGTSQGFVQFGEGLRIKPVFFNDHLALNYYINFQQFYAPSSTYSFRRFTTDFAHEIPLFGTSRSQFYRDQNGPDECGTPPRSDCPPITSLSHDRKGTLTLRLYMSQSIASAGNAVPFYLQPTLGGSDINGTPALPSYQDYRFRGPNVLLIRESFEHSIWGPLGLLLIADQGKIAMRREDLDFTHLRHSFSTGITVRAGGMPAMQFLFSWGGKEGTHSSATIDTSLLGGSRRPSLY